MTHASDSAAVSCEFFGLDSDATFAVTSAVIDQLSALADPDALLLEAIEVPLIEVLDSLRRANAEVSSMTAKVDDDAQLVIDITAPVGVNATTDSLFGDGRELIEAFFDVSVGPDRVGLRLGLD